MNGLTRLACLAILFACAAVADRALAVKSGRHSATAPALRSTTSLCGQPVVPIALAFGDPSSPAGECSTPVEGGRVIAAWAGVHLPPCETGPCAGLAPADYAAVRCQFGSGYTGCVALGQALPVVHPSHSGEFRRGLQQRWDRDSDRRAGICLEDYTGNGARLLLVPLTDAAPAGEGSVTVTGFATCFLVERPPEGPFSVLVVERLTDRPTRTAGGTWGGWKRRYRQ